MQQEIDEVLAKLNSLLAGDGSKLTLVEVKGDSLVARFEQGDAGACERCVIDTSTIEMLVHEAVTNHLPSITKVKLV